ncbi:MAG: class I SAM-dependent methyltransferase [Chthonomonas sp.]|nr:class I SAM-dependent methyltransferase [Chthonomonas sp.]
MRSVEDRYWWFVARRRLAIELLRDELSQLSGRKLLDFGCGTGAALAELQAESFAVGVDFSSIALELAAERGLTRLVQGDGEHVPLRADQFEGMIALDIFEHIQGVEAAFAEAYRILAPGGVLVLSVPAYRWLWGPHDVALMHKRRYTRSLLRRQLGAAGFEVSLVSYSVFWLFPVVVFLRLIDKFRRRPAAVSLPQVGDALNGALIKLMAWETPLIRRWGLPWGSSVIAVARKSSSGNT